MWSSSLSAAAKVRAHNSWVVPLIDWFRRELEQLDVRTRALLIKCEAHCPNASKDRLLSPKNRGWPRTPQHGAVVGAGGSWSSHLPDGMQWRPGSRGGAGHAWPGRTYG